MICAQAPCCLKTEGFLPRKEPLTLAKNIEKSNESALKISLSSQAVRMLFGEKFSLEAAGRLFFGQFGSAFTRNLASDLIDNPVYKCATHAGIQAGRNLFRGTNVLSGAIDGAGYCITNEISEDYKENGEVSLKSLGINVLGSYVTEITENIPYCLAGPVACKLAIAKGAATATVVSVMQIYDYVSQV
jgi:hypothetical protein